MDRELEPSDVPEEETSTEVPTIETRITRTSTRTNLLASKNAAFVTEEIKGAVTLEEKGLRGFILAETISQLLENDQEALKKMKGALRNFKKEENKQDLCSVVLKTL